MKVYVLFLSTVICLNLSHGQAPPTPTSTTAAPTTTTTTPSTPSTVSPPVSPLTTILNSAQPNGFTPPGAAPVVPGPPTPKYEEFQSTCRTNDFDTISSLSDLTKQKRLHLIEEKLKVSPNLVKLKLRLFKEYANQKNISSAENIFQELKTNKASDLELLICEAVIASLKKDHKKARDLFNKILQEQPKNIEALKWLADEYKAEKNYYEASAIYYDLIKISNENQDESLCEVLTLDAHYAEAEPFCNKGARLKKSPFFNIYLGIAAREKLNLKDARVFFKDSLRIQETEMAHSCLAETYVMEKSFVDAEKNYLNAVSINPKSTRALLGVAWANFNNKDRVKALEFFKKSCQADKTTNSEIRKSLKILLNEKSELTEKYSEQIQRCLDN